MDQKAQKIREQGLKKSGEEIDEILYQKKLPYVLEIIRIKLISKYHNDLLVSL